MHKTASNDETFNFVIMAENYGSPILRISCSYNILGANAILLQNKRVWLSSFRCKIGRLGTRAVRCENVNQYCGLMMLILMF